ncbi:MAG: hypothetical protein EBU33_07100 [Sphingobacteriia bacterium]|nr:hypothetical protein [Sphingobacteriia bacterium]
MNNQFKFDNLDAVPKALALWAAVHLLGEYAHHLNRYDNEHHGEVLKLQVEAKKLAKLMKEESAARFAAKKHD